jgi:hypothetical protein
MRGTKKEKMMIGFPEEDFSERATRSSITLRDKEMWERVIKRNSSDFFSATVVCFAAVWVEQMEACIAIGENVEQCARKAKEIAMEMSPFFSGMTGQMVGYAANILVGVWIHGQELRSWYKGEYQV